MGLLRRLFGGGGGEGLRVELDRGPQRLHLEAAREDDPAIEPLLPLQAIGRGFLPAALLIHKAKQLDDGIYAAVELAAQEGSGTFGGKARLLSHLARALSGAGPTPGDRAAHVLLAAHRLGGGTSEFPASLQAAVEQERSMFLGDAARSKPISFYTWSEALARVFRQDRMLQTALLGREGVERVSAALFADAAQAATYGRYLQLTSKLTAPHVEGTRAFSSAPLPAEERAAFFPPSRAPETELVKKMFGQRSIPDGFDLADELLERVRAGTLDLRPGPSAGWYDHTLWSFVPLASPEKTPEGARFTAGKHYREVLERTFKAAWALARETHVKQLEMIAAGAAPFQAPKATLTITPDLDVEPLATMYERRAAAYRFVRGVIEGCFGEGALAGIRRVFPDGAPGRSLAEELDDMEALLLGARARALHRLGDDAPGDEAPVDRFLGSLLDDPDLRADARMMVPLFYDVERRKTKVWVFLGWQRRRLFISFAAPPGVRVFDAKDRDVTANVTVQHGTSSHDLVVPVVRELYVSRLLDRNEVRRACDQGGDVEVMLRRFT